MATTTQFVFANFFESELIAGLTASSTTMMISPSDAAKLPIITAGSNMQAQLTIWDGQLPPEIVGATVNDQSGTMTILRAQEGTVAQAWSSGTQVRSSITALVLNTALQAYFDINTVLNSHFLPLTGGALTGPLTLPADPTVAQQAATKHYVDSVQGSGLPITGGTMQGPINMAGAKILNLADPGSPQDAVTKNYADTALALKAPINNPALTGTPTAPTATAGSANTQIATTAYVDSAVGGIGGAWGAGDVKLTFKNVADTGWLMMDDTTIGQTASTATHKNDLYVNLFTLLFNNITDTWCPLYTAAGVLTTRAAIGSPSTAFTSGYLMALPKVLGRALGIAGAGGGLTARALGTFLGEENHQLTAAESVPHRHVVVVDPSSVSVSVTYPQVVAIGGGNSNGAAEGNATGPNIGGSVSAGFGGNAFGGNGPTVHDNSGSQNRTGNAIAVSDTQYFGSSAQPTPVGVAGLHNNMSPESFLNVMIKY